MAKDVSDISRIALGAVTDKDFAGFQIDAARSVIVPDDGIYQEIITLFGTVTVECLFVCQLVYCLMHGFDGSLRQRAGYISDTQTDKVRFGMRDFECIYLFGNVRKQVIVW